jgi:hypothetical protein
VSQTLPSGRNQSIWATSTALGFAEPPTHFTFLDGCHLRLRRNGAIYRAPKKNKADLFILSRQDFVRGSKATSAYPRLRSYSRAVCSRRRLNASTAPGTYKKDRESTGSLSFRLRHMFEVQGNSRLWVSWCLAAAQSVLIASVYNPMSPKFRDLRESSKLPGRLGVTVSP